MDSKEVPDHHEVQLRALIELFKLHGLYPMRGDFAAAFSHPRNWDHGDTEDLRVSLALRL